MTSFSCYRQPWNRNISKVHDLMSVFKNMSWVLVPCVTLRFTGLKKANRDHGLCCYNACDYLNCFSMKLFKLQKLKRMM